MTKKNIIVLWIFILYFSFYFSSISYNSILLYYSESKIKTIPIQRHTNYISVGFSDWIRARKTIIPFIFSTISYQSPYYYYFVIDKKMKLEILDWYFALANWEKIKIDENSKEIWFFPNQYSVLSWNWDFKIAFERVKGVKFYYTYKITFENWSTQNFTDELALDTTYLWFFSNEFIMSLNR